MSRLSAPPTSVGVFLPGLLVVLVLSGLLTAQASRPTSKPTPPPTPAPQTGGPLAVSGKVLDNSMHGIYAAKITLQVRESDGTWVDIIWDDGDTYSDTNGNFEVRRPLQSHELYRVLAQKDGHWLEAPVEFTPGKTGVELNLSPAGALAGSFILDKSVYPSNVTIEVRRALLPSETVEDLTIWHPHEDGTFRLSPLRRGLYSVRVTCDSGRDILLNVDPVAVRDGETSADPRLQKVDFTKLLKGVSLKIVDENGKKVEGAKVVVLPSLKTSPISHDIFYSNTDHVFLLLRHMPIDVAVVAPGRARVRLKDVLADQTVVMRPGIPVKVTLSGGGKIPEAPLYLQASLETESDMKESDAEARRALGMDQGVDPISFDQTGVAQLTAPAPGKYFVIVSVARKLNRVTTAAAVPKGTMPVSVGASATSVFVDIPALNIERALNQVGVK
jgi:hypothetical protein